MAGACTRPQASLVGVCHALQLEFHSSQCLGSIIYFTASSDFLLHSSILWTLFPFILGFLKIFIIITSFIYLPHLHLSAVKLVEGEIVYSFCWCLTAGI